MRKNMIGCLAVRLPGWLPLAYSLAPVYQVAIELGMFGPFAWLMFMAW